MCKLTLQTDFSGKYMVLAAKEGCSRIKRYKVMHKELKFVGYCKRYNKHTNDHYVIEKLVSHVRMLRAISPYKHIIELYEIYET